jgi:DNA (cytosine-5)-methyltransferase 1
MELTAIDIFSGVGGLSKGFIENGFKILLAIEIDKFAAETYKNNHKVKNIIVDDIRNINTTDALKDITTNVTILLGGPPCRGFSDSNRRTRNLENPTNYLYLDYLRFLAALTPEWFIFENVEGIRTLNHGSVFSDFINKANLIGYTVKWQSINCADYGIPQVRNRTIIIGKRDGQVSDFPKKTHGPGLLPYVTVREAIGDLPVLDNGSSIDILPYPVIDDSRLSIYQKKMRNNTGFVQGNLVTKNQSKIIERYKHIPQGKNWESIPESLMENYEDPTRCHSSIYYRLDENKPAKVLGNFRKLMIIHPSQNRGLSIREAARIQSFPDSFIFSGSIGFQQQQVADAVPPMIARIFASWIKAQLPK